MDRDVTQHMNPDRRGFTLIELLLVMVVGALLTSIAVGAFGSVQTRMAVRQARDSFVSMHARVRASAIEFGTTTQLRIDVAGDSVYVTRRDTVIDRIHFRDAFNVDLIGSNLRLCMTPRGYASLSCNDFTSTQTIKFKAATDSITIQIMPMGQLVW